MKILYAALRESIPGTQGGAVHVFEVARQLARRGHKLLTVVKQTDGQAETETMEGFEVVRLPVFSKYLLFRKRPAMAALIRSFQPDLVMERYYNFAGAAIQAAALAHIPSLLEVNAPLIDPPGTSKARVDALTLGWMSRRAITQAQAVGRIVTPLAATIPAEIRRDKIREIPWGANVEAFDPSALDRRQVEELRSQLNVQGRRVVLFLGSFRRWHGVREFVNMAREILQTRQDILFLMVGSGELLEECRGAVKRHGRERNIVLTGAVPYNRVPYYLALAHVGVAPFNTSVHPPLRVGFYWSPLKVHEYMAMALPVVTIDVYPLNQIVREGREGLLYQEGDSEKLRAHVECLVNDPDLAMRLGQAGRSRVVANFSWQRHAEQLEHVMSECLATPLTKRVQGVH